MADWLTSAGLRVWFDQSRLNAGSPVLDELTRQVCNSRACLVLLTATSLTKNYVKHEVNVACEQQVSQPGFTLVAVRTEPALDPTSRFPALRTLSWMTLPNGELNVETARRLLLSLAPPVAQAAGVRHVFVSCGWGEGEQPVTRRVCAPLAARRVRLIGDAVDQKQFGEEGKARVQRIMSGCTGHLMVLPARRPTGQTPEYAYRYFLAEWEISRRLNLARRTLCMSRASLPVQLQAEAIEVGNAENTTVFENELLSLHDETEPISPYVFLATDYKDNADRNEAARDIVEHVLGMECWLGKDYPTEQLREAIVQKVAGANLVFADIACARNEHTNRLQPNLNTCIEAGIATGSRRPVFITALDPETFDPAVSDRTTQVPFMFRNNQIHWYRRSVDYLAKIHRLALATRRRIINDELA
jgi:hypothetical protein